MALIRASCQGYPLLDSYRQLGERKEAEWRQVAAQMIELIPLLEEVCAPVEAWGLLSHERLCLLAVDDFRSPWYVVIAAQAFVGGYDIRYILPAHEAPWPDATVGGHAQTSRDARHMVRTAMVRSGAWNELL